MRLAIVGGALLVVGCASTPVNGDQPVARACTVSKCFHQRDVRDFEVVGQTTLILYVGAQRCPFKVELRGAFCDMTFAPSINFHKGEIQRRDEITDIFGSQRLGRITDDKICSNDIQVGVDGGVFTEGTHLPGEVRTPGAVDSEGRRIDRFGNAQSRCQLTSVESLTDDSLVELYVKRGVLPPPPPIGQGKIEIAPQDTPPAPAAGGSDSTSPPQSPDPSATSGRARDKKAKGGGLVAN